MPSLLLGRRTCLVRTTGDPMIRVHHDADPRQTHTLAPTAEPGAGVDCAEIERRVREVIEAVIAENNRRGGRGRAS
jgi:hypothetical protein